VVRSRGVTGLAGHLDLQVQAAVVRDRDSIGEAGADGVVGLLTRFPSSRFGPISPPTSSS